ncbi:hypothetical protein IWX90DRAFT_373989, partial [Phyllosticta citrichinensis]
VYILASKARNALFRLNRLTNINLGLGPYTIRQLYITYIISIIDYSCQLYLVLYKILGVFKTSPIKAIEIEVGILP